MPISYSCPLSYTPKIELWSSMLRPHREDPSVKWHPTSSQKLLFIWQGSSVKDGQNPVAGSRGNIKYAIFITRKKEHFHHACTTLTTLNKLIQNRQWLIENNLLCYNILWLFLNIYEPNVCQWSAHLDDACWMHILHILYICPAPLMLFSYRNSLRCLCRSPVFQLWCFICACHIVIESHDHLPVLNSAYVVNRVQLKVSGKN